MTKWKGFLALAVVLTLCAGGLGYWLHKAAKEQAVAEAEYSFFEKSLEVYENAIKKAYDGSKEDWESLSARVNGFLIYAKTKSLPAADLKKALEVYEVYMQNLRTLEPPESLKDFYSKKLELREERHALEIKALGLAVDGLLASGDKEIQAIQARLKEINQTEFQLMFDPRYKHYEEMMYEKAEAEARQALQKAE